MVTVIVTCPNCGARYRLSPEVVAKRARLKCAACDHRWVPEAPADIDLEPIATPAPAALQPADTAPPAADTGAMPQPLPTPPQPVELPVESSPDPATPNDFDDDNEEDESPSRPIRSLVAIILGLALAVTATGLWIGRIDAPGNFGSIPLIGDTLAKLRPSGPPLTITIAGTATTLPSGGQVLEITGTITNPGTSRVRVPLLKASLAGAGGTVRRWTISPPVAELAPGASAAFSSTVMGSPPDARTLSVTSAR